MPQMAPMNWLLLFILFSSIMILLMLINFYITIYKPKMNKKLHKSLTINWKW
uniref:ATP synthase complex subunit 8 n=1 Tax=Anthaxia chinensis TaxID=2853461 RepID=A0A8H2SGU3_9COLE|nr:ATP synthase F0 subunit 8 [Anthaxia chinensis]